MLHGCGMNTAQVEIRVGMSVYWATVTKVAPGAWVASLNGCSIRGVGPTRFDAIQDARSELRIKGA